MCLGGALVVVSRFPFGSRDARRAERKAPNVPNLPKGPEGSGWLRIGGGR